MTSLLNFSPKKTFFLGAVLAIGAALLLWLPEFGSLPRGLNRDEAALGYNAYSILKTGKDEWGVSFPISITSFGDQKLPGYVYTLIPFIATFGLESWVVRLPSLLSGIAIIVGMGWVAYLLAQRVQKSTARSVAVSWITFFFIALSPWHLHFSRVAYEAHLALAFFVFGFGLLLWSLDLPLKKQRLTLIISAILFSFTFLTYHSFHIVTPLFLLSFVVIFRKDILKLDRIGTVIGIGIGISTILLLFAGGVMQANAIKSQGISPLSSETLFRRATVFRQASPLPAGVNKLLFNKYTEALSVLGENYVQTVSGRFFFVHGSNHGDHNPGNGRNTHLFVAPLFLLGVFALWQYRHRREAQLVGAWLVISLLPSAITISPLHEIRMMAVWPVIELIAAFGAVMLFFSLPQWFPRKATLALVCILIGLTSWRQFLFYTKIAPNTTPDNSQFHLLAKKIAQYSADESAHIITQSPASSPYIWYVFENKIDPKSAQEQIEHYPATDEGFRHVKRVGNVSFLSIDWDEIPKFAAKKQLILILRPAEISDHQRLSPEFTYLENIVNKQGETLYEVWRFQL